MGLYLVAGWCIRFGPRPCQGDKAARVARQVRTYLGRSRVGDKSLAQESRCLDSAASQPAVLNDPVLLPTLRWCAKGIEMRYGLPVKFRDISEASS